MGSLAEMSSNGKPAALAAAALAACAYAWHLRNRLRREQQLRKEERKGRTRAEAALRNLSKQRDGDPRYVLNHNYDNSGGLGNSMCSVVAGLLLASALDASLLMDATHRNHNRHSVGDILGMARPDAFWAGRCGAACGTGRVVSAAALCGRRVPRADVNVNFSSQQRTCGGVSGTDARSQLPFLAEATVELWRVKLRRDFPAGAELTSNAHGSSRGCNARCSAAPAGGPAGRPPRPHPPSRRCARTRTRTSLSSSVRGASPSGRGLTSPRHPAGASAVTSGAPISPRAR